MSYKETIASNNTDLQAILNTLLELPDKTTSTMTTITIPAGRMKGDIDGDGKIDSVDKNLIAAHMALESSDSYVPITDETALLCADVNNDGELTSADLMVIAAMSMDKTHFAYVGAGVGGDILGNWTVNPNYETEDMQFYTDITVDGITSSNSAIIYIPGSFDQDFFKAECMDNTIRLYVKLCPINELKAIVNYFDGDGSCIVLYEGTDISNKQDKLIGESGQIVGFDENGYPIAQNMPTAIIEVDNTLSIEGSAADAKAVGDAISEFYKGGTFNGVIEIAPEDDIPTVVLKDTSTSTEAKVVATDGSAKVVVADTDSDNKLELVLNKDSADLNTLAQLVHTTTTDGVTRIKSYNLHGDNNSDMNAFTKIKAGNYTLLASSKDTINIAAGKNIEVSSNPISNTVTISSNYEVVSTEANGLVPKLPTPTSSLNPKKFLREDGTWVVPPDSDTIVDTKVTSAENHYAPEPDKDHTIELTANDDTTNTNVHEGHIIYGIDIYRDSKGHLIDVDIRSTEIPTVPSWAKAETKPSYTASEITTDDGKTVKEVLDNKQNKISGNANSIVVINENNDVVGISDLSSIMNIIGAPSVTLIATEDISGSLNAGEKSRLLKTINLSTGNGAPYDMVIYDLSVSFPNKDEKGILEIGNVDILEDKYDSHSYSNYRVSLIRDGNGYEHITRGGDTYSSLEICLRVNEHDGTGWPASKITGSITVYGIKFF